MNRAEIKRLKRQYPNDAVCLSWISGGTVDHWFMESVLKTLWYDRGSEQQRIISPFGGFISMESSPRIVEARTQLIDNFLSDERLVESEWLVTLDADMTWDPPDIHRLIEIGEEHKAGVIGGLCFGGGRGNNKMFPTGMIANQTNDEGAPLLVNVEDACPEEFLAACEKGAPIKVDATGAAFMAVHRRVLKHMLHEFGKDGTNPFPWYGEMMTPAGVSYGEDVTFCLRARQLGYEVWLATDVNVGHRKMRTMNKAEYKRDLLAWAKGRKPNEALTLP